MSEIEKMYENVGFKKDLPINLADLDFSEEDCDELCLDNSCDECRYKTFPPFTAEKQLAILQLLTQQCDLTISHFTEWEFIHYDGQEPLQITGEDFTETFAKLINAYWQDLAVEEKQQIKKILE